MKESLEIIAKEVLTKKQHFVVKIVIATTSAVVSLTAMGAVFIHQANTSIRQIVKEEISVKNASDSIKAVCEANKDSFIYSIIEKQETVLDSLIGIQSELSNAKREINRLKLEKIQIQSEKKNSMIYRTDSNLYRQELTLLNSLSKKG